MDRPEHQLAAHTRPRDRHPPITPSTAIPLASDVESVDQGSVEVGEHVLDAHAAPIVCCLGLVVGAHIRLILSALRSLGVDCRPERALVVVITPVAIMRAVVVMKSVLALDHAPLVARRHLPRGRPLSLIVPLVHPSTFQHQQLTSNFLTEGRHRDPPMSWEASYEEVLSLGGDVYIQSCWEDKNRGMRVVALEQI